MIAILAPYICPHCNVERCEQYNGMGIIWGKDLPYQIYPKEPWVISEETKERWKRLGES